MINILKTKKIGSILLMTIVAISCEREIAADAPLATNAKTAEIFTDTPIDLGSNFYFPYGGSKQTAWSVDQSVSYKGNASMRVDVPNATNQSGDFAGAILRVDGAPRDLSGFDCLTFWAKATQGVVIGEIGFGEDH